MEWTLWQQLDDMDFLETASLASHAGEQTQDETAILADTYAKANFKVRKDKTNVITIIATSAKPVMKMSTLGLM